MKYALILVPFLILISCRKKIEIQDLEGKWEYLKVEYLNEQPKRIEEGVELQEKKAFIQFNKNHTALISSSGKVLSQGKFEIEGEIIRYMETLEDGSVRKIPFLIKSLGKNDLIFESMERDTKRITAKKNW